jgi:hypothetical protein
MPADWGGALWHFHPENKSADNESKMAETLLRWGFTEEARYEDGHVEYKLARG